MTVADPATSSVDLIEWTPDACSGQNHDPFGKTVAEGCNPKAKVCNAQGIAPSGKGKG